MERVPEQENPSSRKANPSHIELEDNSRVAVIGGGPAGSFFSYFFLDMVKRAGLELDLDIYEPKDFAGVGPAACNMCGGIISELLIQNLAAEGINLPSTVVQRGIDSYMLHMDVGSVRIKTPLDEKRIGAVYRAGGPRDQKESRWSSFDGFMLELAAKRGAHIVRGRIEEVGLENGRPLVRIKDGPSHAYDLLVVAVGVNSGVLNTFRDSVIGYRPPRTTKTFIIEYLLGEGPMESFLGSSMHVYLLNIPGLEFAAIIPKGDYASVCLLGDRIDRTLLKNFLGSPEVRRSMPRDWNPDVRSCHCSPRMNIRGAVEPFSDRVVFIGDSGVTRLYKDGIGAAYRTAKAAAATAVFEGISKQDFKRHYWPICGIIKKDNNIGRFVFGFTQLLMRARFARLAVFRMVSNEQRFDGRLPRMSTVLWDMFTGSATYREILMRTLNPGFLFLLFREVVSSIVACMLPCGRSASGAGES